MNERKGHQSTGRSTEASRRGGRASRNSPRGTGQSSTLASCGIILAYKDGERHIKEQVESIYRQTHANFHLYVFDDASHVPYAKMARKLKLPSGRTSVFHRKRNVGYGQNFLRGLAEAGGGHDYYAYSDQDDIWHDDKLEKAIGLLDAGPDEVALHFCALDVVDENGLLLTPNLTRHTKPTSFANALVDQICFGNTMVMTSAARELVAETAADSDLDSHERWTHVIVAGAGGRFVFDPQARIKYRQHASNLYGASLGIFGRVKYYFRILGGLQVKRVDAIVAALQRHRERLTPHNRRILDIFAAARQAWLPVRVWGMLRSGVHRQSHYRNLTLIAGVLLKRI